MVSRGYQAYVALALAAHQFDVRATTDHTAETTLGDLTVCRRIGLGALRWENLSPGDRAAILATPGLVSNSIQAAWVGEAYAACLGERGYSATRWQPR